MSASEEYAPSPTGWVRDAVAKIVAAGDTKAGQFNSKQPVVLLTMRGAKTGQLRKVPLMRVERDGRYLAVASLGGAPKHPVWYYNLLADPKVTLQDGTETHEYVARELDGDERAEWWELAGKVFPNYLEYQQKTERLIPVFLLEPVQ
ncbi:nitroreductase family deazaflavin-dependent oxidoreductase [Kribbella sp. CA-293567]|uniref:nitroreductase family deazaflavin-dependent oxidoreductase n=1 Tax=Kribbella sp. CA-293567 TaxID=3002436 RepID=UPI0022DD7240|nr:nitroreductase family deazaflavin-dependent oxidoreductase [Kribbella sp. CA-293567]WBQ03291.1 nitroreductase family deazaflavin-dependent oxidoreductase [Kribbella sp. CA-293567]